MKNPAVHPVFGQIFEDFAAAFGVAADNAKARKAQAEMKLGKEIITDHIFPPIPVRSFDWTAYVDGEEEGAQGWGETEVEAVRDLIEQLEADGRL